MTQQDFYKLLKADGHVITNIPESMRRLADEYMQDSDDFLNWFDSKYVKTTNVDNFVSIRKDIYKNFVKSDLYNNLTKKEKRKMNYKKIIQEVEGNPTLRPLYRDRYRKIVDGKQLNERNVLIMYREIPEDDDDEKEEKELAMNILEEENGLFSDDEA